MNLRRTGYFMAAFTVLVILLVMFFLWLPEPASAHTPSASATCDGVTISATNYEAKDTNTIMVTVEGVTKTEGFEVNGSVTVPVPQDGVVHHWEGAVATNNPDPAFSKGFSGTVGPCGEVTPTEEPKPSVEPSVEPEPEPNPKPTDKPQVPVKPKGAPGEKPVVTHKCLGGALVTTTTINGEQVESDIDNGHPDCVESGQQTVEEGF